MSLKRPHDSLESSSPSPSSSSKRSRYGDAITPGRVCKPRRKYSDHSSSGVGRNFHALPYPLSLLPYDSWNLLHHGTDREPEQPLKCSKCNNGLSQPTSHQHKLFLVAERLSWENGIVSYKQREWNERLNWGVNYQLGIVEPAVEEDSQDPGGARSRTNPWHPYQTEHEMEASMGLIAKATVLSKSSWKVWLDMTEAIQPLPPNDAVKLACGSTDDTSLANSGDHPITCNHKPLKEISSGQIPQSANGDKRCGSALAAPHLSTRHPSSPLDPTNSTTRSACSSTRSTSRFSPNSHPVFSEVPIPVLDRLWYVAETDCNLRQIMNRLKVGREHSTDKKKFERIWKEVECNMKPDQSNVETSKPLQQIHTFNSSHASTSMDSSWTAYRSATKDQARRAQLQNFIKRRQKNQSCPSKCLAGMLLAFYGTFDTLGQNEGASLVSKHGGMVVHLASQSVDYIVLGRDIKRIQFSNLWSPRTKMIGEVEFYQLLSCPADISIKSDPPSTHLRMNGLPPHSEDGQAKTSERDKIDSHRKRLKQEMAPRAERAAAMCSETSTMRISMMFEQSRQGIATSNRKVKHREYPPKSLIFEKIGDRALKEPWLDHLLIRLQQGNATDFEKRLYNNAIEEFRTSLRSVQEGSVSQAVADIRLNVLMGVMERRLKANAEVPPVGPNDPSHAKLTPQGQVAEIETKTRRSQSNSKTGSRTVLRTGAGQSAPSTAFNGELTRISGSGPGVEERVCIDLTTEPATITALHVPDKKSKVLAPLAEQHSGRQQHIGTEAKPESLESSMANFTTLKLSCRTLPEFYSMLDKIERTSYVGARYLEAYAEYLQNTDSCSNCWFEKRMMSEEELEELEDEIRKAMSDE